MYTSGPPPADYIRLVLARELNIGFDEVDDMDFILQLKILGMLSTEAKVAKQKSRRR